MQKNCSARTQHIAHQWIWFKTFQFIAPIFWSPHLPTIAFKWKAYAYCYIYILCNVNLLESPNVVFQKMTVTVIWGSQCFIQHLQHQVSTVFLTRNFKHVMVTGITIWWNVLRQLNEQINNRTMVAERSHRKNRSNSYIITKKSEKNYYLKKNKLKKKKISKVMWKIIGKYVFLFFLQ